MQFHGAGDLFVPPDTVPIDLRDVWFPVEDHIGWASPRSKFVWLYVIHCERYTKVGIAGDVVHRLSGLTGSTPFEVVLHNAYRVPRTLSRRADTSVHCWRSAHRLSHSNLNSWST